MAELEYGKLIKDNPENLEYIAGLQKARGLDKGISLLPFFYTTKANQGERRNKSLHPRAPLSTLQRAPRQASLLICDSANPFDFYTR